MVLLDAYTAGVNDAGPTSEQHRIWVAPPKRRKLPHELEAFARKGSWRRRGIDLDGRNEHIVGKILGGTGNKLPSHDGKIPRRDGEPRRFPAAAVSVQTRASGSNGVHNVELGDAARAGPRLILSSSDDDRRPIELLAETIGDQAEYPPAPRLAFDEQERRQDPIGRGADLLNGLFDSGGGQRLAFIIGGFQAVGERPSFRIIGRREQIQAVAGMVDTPPARSDEG